MTIFFTLYNYFKCVFSDSPSKALGENYLIQNLDLENQECTEDPILDEDLDSDKDFNPMLVDSDSSSTSANSSYTVPVETENYVIENRSLHGMEDGLSNDSFKAPQDESPKRRRSSKYKVRKNNWQKNKNRCNREQGKSYMGKKKQNGKWDYKLVKEPRNIKQACFCILSGREKSALKCREIGEDERQIIFKTFWQITWPEKKMFVRNHVLVKPTKRKRGSNDVSRRDCSNEFYLGRARKRVCKMMFLNTLGVKEWVVKNWAKKNIANQEEEHAEDPRLYNSPVGARIKILHDFFDSLPKLESHYCRASTSKLYLEPMWNSKSKLYKLFKEDFCKNRPEKPVSIATFHKEFDKKKLSLYRPKKDLCDICVAFETGNLAEEKYQEHINLKNEARAEKSKDKESPNEVFTMDLQSVLLSPRSTVSSLYYKTKLIVHNFTIYDIKRQQGYCYLWNESEGGLTSNEFTSIVVHFLEAHINAYLPPERRKDINIILWSDGCGYQNRNATLSNGLFNLAMDKGVTIEQKYLQKGHTQMEVDSVHSVIERQIRNKKINIPADYVYVCRTACQKQPYKVEYLTHNFFLKFDNLKYFTSIRPGKLAGSPVVNDIKALKYTNLGVSFKLKHSDECWNTLPIRLNLDNIKATSVSTLPQLHKNRLKIKAEKYRHLQQLKLSMEADYHNFYDNLPHD